MDEHAFGLLRDMEACYQAMLRPYPSADIARLLSKTRIDQDLFCGHLELYWLEIAGLCCDATSRRRGWPPLGDVSRSFWERYPEYSSLADKIDAALLPELAHDFRIYELGRLLACEFLEWRVQTHLEVD